MRKVLVVIAILTLSGCHLLDLPGSGTVSPPTGDGPGTVVTPPVEPDPGTVITPPEKTPDWPVSLETMAEKLVKGAAINKDETLLVDTIKNSTNTDLDTTVLTSQFMQVVGSTKRFTLVPQEQMMSARQALGLQDEDSLNTRSKTIGLARYLAVPYILYTSIEGKDLELTLSSQIMQVQTGELIWSEKTPVKLN